MRACLIAVLLALSAPLCAELVNVKAVLEPQTVAPGGEAKLHVKFTVQSGYHAYHKDNPGYGKKLEITFSELSGLKQKGEPTWPQWHEWKDKDDPNWIEYELSGEFEIVYTFTVPADAKGALKIAGKYVGMACDDKGCTAAEGSFSAQCEVTGAAPKAAALPAGELIAVGASLEGTGGKAAPGKEVTLKLHFIVADSFHVYAKDNPGIGKPLSWEFTELSGLTQKAVTWPEHHIEFPDEKDKTWSEWELTGEFDIAVTFTVPSGAKGTLSVSGKFEAQVCDANACQDRAGEFSAEIGVEASSAPAALTEAEVRSRWKVASIKRGTDEQVTLHQNGADVVVLRPTWVVYFFGDTRGYGRLDQLGEGLSRGEVYFGNNEALVYVLFNGNALALDAVPLDKVEVRAGDLTPDVAALKARVDDQNKEISTLKRELEKAKKQIEQLTRNARPDLKDEHGFYTDYDVALAEAKKQGKLLLIDFNGEY